MAQSAAGAAAQVINDLSAEEDRRCVIYTARAVKALCCAYREHCRGQASPSKQPKPESDELYTHHVSLWEVERHCVRIVRLQSSSTMTRHACWQGGSSGPWGGGGGPAAIFVYGKHDAIN